MSFIILTGSSVEDVEKLAGNFFAILNPKSQPTQTAVLPNINYMYICAAERQNIDIYLFFRGFSTLLYQKPDGFMLPGVSCSPFD